MRGLCLILLILSTGMECESRLLHKLSHDSSDHDSSKISKTDSEDYDYLKDSHGSQSDKSSDRSISGQRPDKENNSEDEDDRPVCIENGVKYPVGTFTDPDDKCRICTCKISGHMYCKRRECKKTKCGEDLLVPTSDGCCQECHKNCVQKQNTCPKLKCEDKYRLYPKNSCCPECGCLDETGNFVNEGPVISQNPCDNCNCKDGKIKCNHQVCPENGLQCVDPRRADNCDYVCPQGKTCSVNGVTIFYGEIKQVGNQICTCAGKWFPNAFCAPIEISKDIRNKQNDMCVSMTKPEIMDYAPIM